MKYKSCVRCHSENLDKVSVNTALKLNYPEEKIPYSSTIYQKTIQPTDALVCKDCGHVELFVDWEKYNTY